MSEIPAESLQATLAQANEVARSYGPLGGSLGILELKPTFEKMKSTAEDLARSIAAAKQELQGLLSYQTALQMFIVGLEQRAHELATGNTEEERRLQGRLSEIEGRIAQADEIRRQAENASNRSVEEVARWVRSVRGG